MVNYQVMLHEQFGHMALIVVDVYELLAIICVSGFLGHSVDTYRPTATLGVKGLMNSIFMFHMPHL